MFRLHMKHILSLSTGVLFYVPSLFDQNNQYTDCTDFRQQLYEDMTLKRLCSMDQLLSMFSAIHFMVNAVAQL